MTRRARYRGFILGEESNKEWVDGGVLRGKNISVEDVYVEVVNEYEDKTNVVSGLGEGCLELCSNNCSQRQTPWNSKVCHHGWRGWV